MDFKYLKNAIKNKNITFEELAKKSGTSKGYISQLINGKIKNPSIKNLNSLHEALNIKEAPKNKSVGIIFGKFYPLHTGHIHMIQSASGVVDELHVYMCHDYERDFKLFEESNMTKQPSVQDRLKWMQQTFKYQDTVKIHSFDESGLPSYPNGWTEWANRVKKSFNDFNISPNKVFTNERQDVDKYKSMLNLDSVLTDPDRRFMNISATKIRKDPMNNWNHIPSEVRPFFVKTVVILGGESSGKSTLINKLANAFNTTSAWEYGREYIFKELGGDEQALQYSDYPPIALGQAQYIEYAVKRANKVSFIDTDFLTTQAFCKEYEGKEHPFLNAMIKQYPFDKVILLENNTPWVADGLRSLGTEEKRQSFQDLLVKLLNKHNIEYTTIQSSDYDQRYQECIDIVLELINNDKENILK